MGKTTGHILKSDEVKLEGQFQLEIGQTMQNSENEKKITSVTPQVRIVENHPEFAVMEITCCCGTKTHIKCEYTKANSAEEEPEQKNNGENDNES